MCECEREREKECVGERVKAVMPQFIVPSICRELSATFLSRSRLRTEKNLKRSFNDPKPLDRNSRSAEKNFGATDLTKSCNLTLGKNYTWPWPVVEHRITHLVNNSYFILSRVRWLRTNLEWQVLRRRWLDTIFYQLTEESNPGRLGEKREHYLCAMPSPPRKH